MKKFIADLHLHSQYSRAVSERMILFEMAQWGVYKGIDLLGTADFTHPLWFRELQSGLEEAGKGLYQLKQRGEIKGTVAQKEDTDRELRFLLSTELSCIYSQDSQQRRIHLVVLAPSLETVEKINQALASKGIKLMSDGRPIMGMSAQQLMGLILAIDENCIFIPAHIWTPWYSLYGSRSGFDSIEECFGEFADNVTAIETGLSSDPAMNWRIAELENRAIVSFSDAHSPEKLGREATIFEGELSYQGVVEALRWPFLRQPKKPLTKVVGTIEFYPEEGKYHYTGHRNCNIRHSPQDSVRLGTTCPVCGKPLTVGVMHRVEELASKDWDLKSETQTSDVGVRWIQYPGKKHPPYVMLVPLMEIIAEAKGQGVNTQGVKNDYLALINQVGSEFEILLKTKLSGLEKVAGARVVEGIKKVRAGDLVIEPGYDGVFGTVKIFGEDERMETEELGGQMELFG
jgi:uncharacterized protein (TIGR00375 family)